MPRSGISLADYGAYETDPREARAGQRLLFRRKPQKQSRGLTRQRQTYRALATKGFAVLFCPMPRSGISLADYGACEPDPREAYSTAPLVVFHNYRRQNCATVQKSFTAIDNAVVR